ncbi:MAG TPA: hypothetical protein VFW92_03055 [Candidatus Limnocylindrales bacterium]|nr:hypothetical protein [Candidatus Limnocylindrales bacterium]
MNPLGLIPAALSPGPWAAVALLGAVHGLDPAMGWLFAVARGLQEQDRRVVLRSLLPLALGHELSLAIVVGPLILGSAFVAAGTLRLAAAGLLIGFGAFRLARRRHPGWVGMRIGQRELVAWSFLMASAHGAGLMVMAPVLGMLPPAGDSLVLQAGPGQLLLVAGAALLVHVTATVLVMGTIALVVFERLGLDFLRRAWLNLDEMWALALVGAGGLTLFT